MRVKWWLPAGLLLLSCGRTPEGVKPASWETGFWFGSRSEAATLEPVAAADVLFFDAGRIDRGWGRHPGWHVYAETRGGMPAAKVYWPVLNVDSGVVPDSTAAPAIQVR